MTSLRADVPERECPHGCQAGGIYNDGWWICNKCGDEWPESDPFYVVKQCPHTSSALRTVRSNSGDGSPSYDFYTVVCQICDAELEQADDVDFD